MQQVRHLSSAVLSGVQFLTHTRNRIAMYKSWWWNRRAWKLDKRRFRALSFIEGERLLVEEMAQRPRQTGDPFSQDDKDLFGKVVGNLGQIEERAKSEADYSKLGELMDDAETQGQYRAYFCPAGDVVREGELVISVITTEWGLPKSVTDDIRKNGADLKKTTAEARAALHFLFSERDSWADYTTDYEDTMQSFTLALFGLTATFPFISALCFRFAFHFHPLLVLGVVGAGTAGSSVSIMRRMPEFEVRLSNELDAYRRRIMSRIGVGLAASLVGSALLGWGVLPVSIQGHTFTDAVHACTTSICNGVDLLLLLGVPMLLGFSERALTTIEERLFGGRMTRRT